MSNCLSSNQVEQREEKDPNQIDQVPVQANRVNGREIIWPKVTSQRSFQHPANRGDSRNDVNRVQSGHGKVDTEEGASSIKRPSARLVTGRILRRPEMTFVPLV